MDEKTDGRTEEIKTPISHLAKEGATKKETKLKTRFLLHAFFCQIKGFMIIR